MCTCFVYLLLSVFVSARANTPNETGWWPRLEGLECLDRSARTCTSRMDDKPNFLSKGANGSLLLTGEYATNGWGENDAFVRQVSASGNPDWSYIVPSDTIHNRRPSYAINGPVVAGPNGSSYHVGTVYAFEKLNGVYLQKLNTTGGEVWTRKTAAKWCRSGVQDIEHIGIAADRDGSVVLLGQDFYVGKDGWGDIVACYKIHYLARYSSGNDEISYLRLPSISTPQGWHLVRNYRALLLLSNGELIVLGSTDFHSPTIHTTPMAAKHAVNFTRLWESTLTLPAHEDGWRATSIASLGEDSFLVAGTTGYSASGMVFISKFNVEGGFMWQHFVSSAAWPTSAGFDGAIAAGSADAAFLVTSIEFGKGDTCTGQSLFEGLVFAYSPEGSLQWNQTLRTRGMLRLADGTSCCERFGDDCRRLRADSAVADGRSIWVAGRTTGSVKGRTNNGEGLTRFSYDIYITKVSEHSAGGLYEETVEKVMTTSATGLPWRPKLTLLLTAVFSHVLRFARFAT
eukprot:TRINITY_DN103310_c0_g1_i1.p1 TRINITY_DN103310_c0_g1~~TRINITY_DN103310_c0_g1_i1.p1  ORF type:complete len:513 (-),score=56.96 TRINITY_DN103310_c0_g1_i1:138-1676(-)